MQKMIDWAVLVGMMGVLGIIDLFHLPGVGLVKDAYIAYCLWPLALEVKAKLMSWFGGEQK